MNNNEDISRLVDNLKKLNEELEKMNKQLENNVLRETGSCFDELSSKANSLAESLGFVAENEDFLEKIGKKMLPGMSDVDEILGGILGTCSSFLNVIPMIEIGITAASIAFDFLNEALRDKSMDAYYESCVKVSSEIRNFTEGIEEATSMFEGFSNQSLVSAESVKLRAKSIMQMNDMTLENMQQVMHDAEEMRNLELERINQQYSEERAVIEQHYVDKDGVISEAGLEEIAKLDEIKNEKIKNAEETYAATLEIVNQGVLEKMEIDNKYCLRQEEFDKMIQDEEKKHQDILDSISNNGAISVIKKNEMISLENMKHNKKMKDLKNEYYSELVVGNENEVAALMTLAVKMKECGGEMDKNTESFVKGMIDNWDSLPAETRDVMEEALRPMIEEMEKRKPELFKKADGIAQGILGKLKVAFDIHSPSRKTREIFKFLMEGCELGLKDKKSELLDVTDDISSSVLDTMGSVNEITGKIQGAIFHNAYGRSNGASVNESILGVMNRIAQSKGTIHTVLNIDGREFAVATSGYMKEELAFMR